MNLLTIKNDIFLNTVTFFLIFLFSTAVHAKLNFYFYYPDSPTSNMSQLKNEMDHLFNNKNIDVNFQPFARAKDFESQINKNGDAVFMSPAWVLRKNTHIQMKLNAFSGGKSQYGKVFITKSTSNLTVKGFKGATLAMTAMGNTEQVDLVLQNKIKSKNIHIIEVSKDIDAIFAVALKQVDGAFVTTSSLARIKKMNPRIIASIKVITDAHFLSLPSIYSVKNIKNHNEVAKLLNFMKELKDIRKNPFSKLLEIDEWREAK